MLKLIKSWFFNVEPKVEEDIKWVRIICEEGDTKNWYRYKKGHHYPVKEYLDNTYIVVSEDKELLFIDKNHTVIENV